MIIVKNHMLCEDFLDNLGKEDVVNSDVSVRDEV